MRAKASELAFLRSAELAVSNFELRWPEANRQEARFQLLEAVASRLGGFDLGQYFKEFKTKPVLAFAELLEAARNVLERLGDNVHPALSISVLARETLALSSQRTSGAYHTDYRLALHLASGVAPSLGPSAKVIDPSCGAGILLVALSLKVCGADRRLASEWLATSVYAADLSSQALRGAQLSLACLTDDVGALGKMRSRWVVGDSLLRGASAWKNAAADGFDAVIANPPWEKLKVSRHEFIQEQGGARLYGSDYDSFDEVRYAERIDEIRSYSDCLCAQYDSIRSGEPDLFQAFSELAFDLAKPGGRIALILPAGLIRSKNTEALRRLMLAQSAQLAIDVLDNKARFFEIDSRFKFLTVQARKRQMKNVLRAIELRHSRGENDQIARGPAVKLGRLQLLKVRPDASVPEVRSEAQWNLFVQASERGEDWSCPDSPWFPSFVREIDMTRDRKLFRRNQFPGAVPLVEGRMVHQHRLGAKSHVAGTGRSATWKVNPPGDSEMAPQFWLDPSKMPSAAQGRFNQARAGFCDITGQTNERSMLAAVIPPGVVCGNKVPTILFANDNSDERLWLWVAIANSMPFDWLLRRVITTTVNYFHLLSLPLPPVDPQSLPGRHLIEMAKCLAQLDRAGHSAGNLWKTARLRAKADQAVLTAYGLDQSDLGIMLADFPLLDRAQPPLPGESRSTITRDLVHAHGKNPELAAAAAERLEAGRLAGAIPYMSNEAAVSRNRPHVGIDGGIMM